MCDKCGGTLVRRKDDDPEAVRTRLRVYDEQTAPVLDWYMQRGDKVVDRQRGRLGRRRDTREPDGAREVT